MASILVVLSELPFPARKSGFGVRFGPILDFLGGRHFVDLFIPEAEETETRLALRRNGGPCRAIFTGNAPSIGLIHRQLRVLEGLLRRHRPPWVWLNPSSVDHAGSIERLIQERQYDAVLFAGLLDETSVVVHRRVGSSPRFVFDWVDSPSLTMDRLSETKTGVEKGLLGYWARRLRRWQKRFTPHLEASIFVADPDRKDLHPRDEREVHVIPNGLLDYPKKVADRAGRDGAQVIGFVGNMSYGPNIQAVLRLVTDIFPRLRAEIPDLRMKIIGRDPAPEIESLACDFIEVTGSVEDIWSPIEEVDLMIFPMRTGAGLQNKILEACRAGCPVITTSICAAPFADVGMKALAVADTDDENVQVAVTLLQDKDARLELADAGLELAKQFDWDTILPQFEQVILGLEASEPAQEPQLLDEPLTILAGHGAEVYARTR